MRICRPILRWHFPALAPRVRFLKVDAEGYDYQVLRSLTDLVVAQKPFIKAEVFKQLRLEQRERLYDLVVAHGYDVFVKTVESDTEYLGTRLSGARSWTGATTTSSACRRGELRIASLTTGRTS